MSGVFKCVGTFYSLICLTCSIARARRVAAKATARSRAAKTAKARRVVVAEEPGATTPGGTAAVTRPYTARRTTRSRSGPSSRINSISGRRRWRASRASPTLCTVHTSRMTNRSIGESRHFVLVYMVVTDCFVGHFLPSQLQQVGSQNRKPISAKTVHKH